MAQISEKKKEAFIEAYKRLSGNISASCKAVDVPRRTYYNWMKDEEFRQDIESAYEQTIDWVESKLLKQIDSNNITAIIFYLKTKGKSRGYVETQDITMTGNLTPQIVLRDEEAVEQHKKMEEM